MNLPQEQARAIKRPIECPEDKEQQAFLEGVKKICPNATILSATFQQPQQTPSPPDQLPKTISSLFDPKYKTMTSARLSVECKSVFDSIKVTKAEADFLAKSTSLQSECPLWYQHRIGRLTASKFGLICRTTIDSPSQSLVSSILIHKHINSAPIVWGRKNEAIAREQYKKLMKHSHQNFSVKVTGLHINPAYPHLGASPDGLVSCDCCGEGMVEIKCPYSIKDLPPVAAVNNRNFFMSKDENGMHLKKSHAYFYQVQGQMAICERSYCDFVCWTPEGTAIERICKDQAFFDVVKEKLDEFFVKVILPRVLTGEEARSNGDVSNDVEESFCYCRKGEFGRMVACDNPHCKVEWFHFKCVGLTSEPTGSWYCPDCKCTLQH